jgi:hypothetical protein
MRSSLPRSGHEKLVAVVVVVVGAVARGITRPLVPTLTSDTPYVGPIAWAGTERHVLFLPHPNARGVPKGVEAYLRERSDPALAALRGALAQATAESPAGSR